MAQQHNLQGGPPLTMYGTFYEQFPAAVTYLVFSCAAAAAAVSQFSLTPAVPATHPDLLCDGCNGLQQDALLAHPESERQLHFMGQWLPISAHPGGQLVLIL